MRSEPTASGGTLIHVGQRWLEHKQFKDAMPKITGFFQLSTALRPGPLCAIFLSNAELTANFTSRFGTKPGRRFGLELILGVNQHILDSLKAKGPSRNN